MSDWADIPTWARQDCEHHGMTEEQCRALMECAIDTQLARLGTWDDLLAVTRLKKDLAVIQEQLADGDVLP